MNGFPAAGVWLPTGAVALLLDGGVLVGPVGVVIGVVVVPPLVDGLYAEMMSAPEAKERPLHPQALRVVSIAENASSPRDACRWSGYGMGSTLLQRKVWFGAHPSLGHRIGNKQRLGRTQTPEVVPLGTRETASFMFYE